MGVSYLVCLGRDLWAELVALVLLVGRSKADLKVWLWYSVGSHAELVPKCEQKRGAEPNIRIRGAALKDTWWSKGAL